MKKNKLSANSVKITAVFACTVFTLIFVALIFYNFNNCFEIEKKGVIREEHLSQLKNDVKDLSRLIQTHKEEKEKFQKILFNDRDVAVFLEEIPRLAKSSKVKILSMKAKKFIRVQPPAESREAVSSSAQKKTSGGNKEEEKGPILSALPIDIKIEGEFKSIVDFLIYLEKYKQLLTLSNIDIKIQNYPLLKSSFTLNLYSLKDIEEIKGGK